MVLQSRRVWLAGQFVPAQLEAADGKIVNVYPFGTKTADVDYGNKRIVPGFIDVHTHGAYGFDTNDGEPEGCRDSGDPFRRTLSGYGIQGCTAPGSDCKTDRRTV